jgi:hypothetical protein
MGDCDVNVLGRIRAYARSHFFIGGSHCVLSVVNFLYLRASITGDCSALTPTYAH